MNPERCKELKRAALPLQPAVRIGKSGLSESIVAEVRRQLHQRRLIKVKLLKPFTDEYDRYEAAEELALKTGGEVVQVIGSTIILAKESDRERPASPNAGPSGPIQR